MTIVDVEAQSEHFLVNVAGKFKGETGGETGYTNVYRGYYNDPYWCLANGYTRGWFRIPAGQRVISIEWPKGTGNYKQNTGVAKFRFDRLCDADNCPAAKRSFRLGM